MRLYFKSSEGCLGKNILPRSYSHKENKTKGRMLCHRVAGVKQSHDFDGHKHKWYKGSTQGHRIIINKGKKNWCYGWLPANGRTIVGLARYRDVICLSAF